MKGHLATFETGRDGATGGLTLGAAACSLATLAADAATVRAWRRRFEPGSGLEIMDLHVRVLMPRRQRRSRVPRRSRDGARGRACRGSRDGPGACWSCRCHADRGHAGCRGASGSMPIADRTWVTLSSAIMRPQSGCGVHALISSVGLEHALGSELLGQTTETTDLIRTLEPWSSGNGGAGDIDCGSTSRATCRAHRGCRPPRGWREQHHRRSHRYRGQRA